jgi:hypothetical protein
MLKSLILISTLVSIFSLATNSAQAAQATDAPAPIFNKTAQFSIRTIVNACAAGTAPVGMSCTIDTLLVAKATDNGDLVWERQVYSRAYETDKPLDGQMILVKNMKFAGSKNIEVRNARGDSFTIEIGHGHLKKPKTPKLYKK